MRVRWLLFLVLAACCSKPQAPQHGGSDEQAIVSGAGSPVDTSSFPITPPDSIPRFTEHMRVGSGDAPYKYLPNLIFVSFKSGARASERARAVRLIGGRVVGGLPGLGLYLVAIEGDSTFANVARACEKIRISREVTSAAPYVLDEDSANRR